MAKIPSTLRAQRNLIRRHVRPRIRMWSASPPVAWIRGRFIDIPLTQELLEDAGVKTAEEWNELAGNELLRRGIHGEGTLQPRGILSRRRLFWMRASSWLRERLRIAGWIFRLLRR